MTNHLDLVTYPEKYKRFGMGLSGGADSAMLLYLMCLKHPAPDYKLYIVTQGSYLDSWYGPITTRATAIVNLIKQKIPNHPIVGHVLYDDSRNTLANMAKELQDGNLIDLYISGTTAHPHDINASAIGDDGVVATLFQGDDHERRDLEYGQMLIEDPGGDYGRPLGRIDKKQIAEMYKEYDVMDLFELTHSCSNDMVTPCWQSHCWWCMERRWAFGK